jgi:hypothetical protein
VGVGWGVWELLFSVSRGYSKVMIVLLLFFKEEFLGCPIRAWFCVVWWQYSIKLMLFFIGISKKFQFEV